MRRFISLIACAVKFLSNSFPDMRIFFLTLLLCLLSACANNHCIALKDDPTAWQALHDAWQDQQVLMILRHAAKCDEEPGCVEDNEDLTPLGKMQAKVIGNGVRDTLGEPFDVYHSDMIRTEDTALLAFGASTVDVKISKPCLPGFKDHVSNLPISTNTILVTHSSCIDSLADREGERYLGLKSGDDAHFGIAAFMQQNRGNELKVLGCVWPKDWPELIQSVLAPIAAEQRE